MGDVTADLLGLPGSFLPPLSRVVRQYNRSWLSQGAKNFRNGLWRHLAAVWGVVGSIG